MMKVSVQDRGAGIPSSLREKVFEKFFRLSTEAGSQSSTEGLGMGLAIARNCSASGHIWIDNDSDTPGTRVLLCCRWERIRTREIFMNQSLS
jgi:signal transduction histidine kinase